METPLNIDDSGMTLVKQEAARQRLMMSELVETALRMLHRSARMRTQLDPLPTFRSGSALVDGADRDFDPMVGHFGSAPRSPEG